MASPTDRILARARQLAAGRLDGVEAAAHELVVEAAGDLPALLQARRVALEAMAADATTEAKQVVSLLRRAIEVGDWDWEGTRP